MKTISKRFLKGGLALLLAFVMLFGTTITGFAAVIDNAETSAEADVTILGANSVASDGKYRLYFKFSGGSTWWNGTGCYHFAWVWGTNMTSQYRAIYKVGTTSNASTGSTTDVFYMDIPSGTLTGMILFRAKASNSFTNGGTTWKDGVWYNKTNDITIPNSIGTYNMVTAVTENSASVTQTSRYTTVSVATKGATVTNASGGSGTSSDPYIVTPGQVMNVSATSTIDDHNFKVGYGYNSSTQYITTATGTVTANSTEGTYNFNVYYTPLLNGSTSYRGTQSSTTVYYKVVQPGYSYTVTAGDGGTASPASGTAPSVEITASPSTGYEFAGWETTNGSVASESSATTTFTPSDNGANAHATFKLKEYKLTISESGATGGTFTVDGAAFTSGNNVTHGTHTLGVTAPTGYKIVTLDGTPVGATTGSKEINVTAAKTVNVVYEANNKCSTSFSDTSTMNLVLGEEKTRTATLSHCTSGGTVNYSSSDTTVATVNATTGEVKALKAGTTTITATCSKGDEGSSATYTVRVNNPTFSVANVSVKVNGTVTAVPTITANEPDGTYSYTFTSHSSNDDYYAVNETTGVITGQKPTTSCLVSVALVYNNTNVATTSFSVKVNEPVASLNKTTLKLLTGQTAQLSVTSTPDYESVAWTPASVATVATDGTVSPTASTGTDNVTATVKYNEFYSKDLTCAVTVASPTLTVSPTTLNLEIGDGSTATTGTVTVTNNDTAGEDGTDAVAPVLEVESSRPDVATAAVVDDKINVTAKALGTTTLTVSYRNATKTVTVNVSQYDPYFTIYLTNNKNFTTPNLWYWDDGKGGQGVNMVYIGKNGQNQNIFAYRFPKDEAPDNILFRDGSSYNTNDIDLSNKTTYPEITEDYAAFALTGDNVKYNAQSWAIHLELPTVSVKDLTVIMGETGTAEATVANGDKVLWTIDDTTYATVADVDTQTATVTSVAPGTTEISARAFVDTANSSIKTLPTNYKTDTACWDYISTEATATVTVDPGSARQITVAPSFSNDGETYTAGVTGGTVNATYESQSGTSLEVPYNGEYTITATPADGYAFNGWTKNNEDIEGGATLTVAAKDNANYVAKFVKTYTVTVATPAGIDSIKINNAPGTTYTAKAGEIITVYGSPAEGYRLGDWTVEGTAEATGTNTATATISNIQSNITVTPSAVKIYTVTYSQGVNRVNATVGTVTVNGSTDNNQDFDAGTEVTLVASSTNRSFYGWYAADDTNFENALSTDATYVIDSLDSNVNVVAMFYRPFTIEGDVPGEQVVLTYDIVTDKYTGTSNDYQGNTFTVKDTFDNTANAADVNVTGGNHTGASVTGNANGYTLVPDTENYDTSAPITYTMRHMGTGTYYLDIALSDAEKVEISVNGVKVAEKAIGSKFSYTIEAPDGQYLSNATITPTTDFQIVDGKIEFTVPNTNVNIVPAFANYSYVEISDSTGITATGLKTGYKAGEEVTITLSPVNAASTLTGVTAEPADNVVITKNGDSYIVTIASMPADTTITLTPTVDTKFKMAYSTSAVGNFDTGVTNFGTVTMSIDGNNIEQDSYAAPSDEVVYTATANADYTFVGFYADAGHTKLLSTEATYKVSPVKDTTIYVLYARKHYISFNSWSTRTEMTYDATAKAYTYESNSITSSTAFKVTNKLTETDNYHTFDGSQFSVDMSGSRGASVSWGSGNNNWYVKPSDVAIPPVTIYVEPTADNAIKVYARAEKVGATVFLSSGRTNLGHATTTITGVTGTSEEVGHDGDSEKYMEIQLTEDQSISWETEIGGTNPEYVAVERYIVYKIEDGTWEVITPANLGNNKFSGSVMVDGDCYIYPVFFHTDAYREATGYTAIEMYFEASAIQNLKWGPFVSCYAWNANKTEKYFGSWPGQLLIPTEDGKSFYTTMDVPPSTAQNPAAGVTFSNYLFETCPTREKDVFGIGDKTVQTYDYREAITLYEAGYEVISFVAKNSTDGYHGNASDGSAPVNTVLSSTTNIFDTYDFEYLYSRDGKTPMDFNGDEIENYADLSTGAKADYYVIAKGDVIYNSGNYSADPNYNGEWSVEWYIFDKDGNYQTKVLSTALYHDPDDDGRTVLLEQLRLTTEQAAGKTVAISYEHSNNAPLGSGGHPSSHQLAYDGQWYGSMLDHEVIGSVKVGLKDGNTFTIDDDETPNEADYGNAYIVDADGNYHQTLAIQIEVGAIDLHSERADGYVFDGWYTMNADGTYNKLSPAYDYNAFINFDETYYAMFREIAAGEVVINHATYNNPNDEVIPSHGGVSEMSIMVRDTVTGDVYNASPNTSRTSVSFTGVEGRKYEVIITTKPLMKGEFFAWYTDSTDVNGEKTYEEVLTEYAQIGSKDPVSATFEYEYSLTSQKTINIYSDVRRVENTAKLIYKYHNREGALKTYTVKVPLTDEECTGFIGNEEREYIPAYLTKYTMSNGTEEVEVYGEQLRDKYVSDSYECVDTYNKITANAPKDEVTQVYNGIVQWEIGDNNLTAETNEVTLFALDGTPTYTINYIIDGVPKYSSGYYDTLLAIKAPATNSEGETFSYWYDRTNDVIAAYTTHYNYKLVENKTIEAVYGVTVTDEWTPTIESVTYTREYSDTTDYVYTDFHLAYTSRDGEELNLIKEEQGIKYGLMMVMDPTYSYDGNGDVEYLTPDVENLETAAKYGKNKLIDGIRYYNFDLTSYSLTNFNRCNYYKRYNNNDTTNNYRGVAYTCYAYLIKDGTVYLSKAKNVNFYEVATMDPSKINN